MNTVSAPNVWATPYAPQPGPYSQETIETKIKERESSISYNRGRIYRAQEEIEGLEDEIRELEKELTDKELAALHAEAAQRVLKIHTPSGPDLEALEAAADSIPLTPHQLCRLKTLAREFLFLCL